MVNGQLMDTASTGRPIKACRKAYGIQQLLCRAAGLLLLLLLPELPAALVAALHLLHKTCQLLCLQLDNLLLNQQLGNSRVHGPATNSTPVLGIRY
jgi:hypothetical protein